MKNKALTYVLIAVVALIWYNAFFRVKENLFGDDEIELEGIQHIEPQFPEIHRDTFLLRANYRDPFGETSAQQESSDTAKQQPQPPAPKPPKPSVAWPDIVYFGQVRKTHSSNPLAILSVDGYRHTIRRGDKLYDGLMLKTVERDSIVIRYHGKMRTFWRN